MSSAVKLFHSGQAGAPQLTNSWGALTTFFDAILVNGFNLKAIDSLTVANGVATATVSAGHGFVPDQIVLIAGADQAAYNGEFRVTEVTTSTFKFAITGNPASPATSSTNLTVKVSPLDFEILFTADKKRAYRSKNQLSNKMILRMDDSMPAGFNAEWSKYARVTVCEGMTDIDTITGARAPYNPANPALNEGVIGGPANMSTFFAGWAKWYWSKSGATSSDNYDSATYNTNLREWVLIGDDRGFYFFVAWHGSYSTSYQGRQMYAFNEFESFRPSDPYRTLLLATSRPTAVDSSSNGTVEASTLSSRMRVSEGRFLARDSSGVGAFTQVFFSTLDARRDANISYDSNNIYVKFPNPADYGFLSTDVFLQEPDRNDAQVSAIRGKLAGLRFIQHQRPFPHLTVIDNVAEFPGRKFVVLAFARDSSSNNDAAYLFDMTGPWR